MKLSVLIIILLFPAISYGQYNNYSFREMFFGRLPSARAEAMGKSYASVDGDISTVFFNPAGTATIKGIEIYSSFASPYYLLPELKFNYFGLAYHFNKYLTVGLNRNQNNYGMVYMRTTENPESISDSGIMTNNVYTLNIASQPIKNLFVGINVNYMVYGFVDPIPKTLFFDFGIIKKFQFKQNSNFQQSINIAANICNLNYSKMTFIVKSSFVNGIERSDNLPVITRYAANYQIAINKHLLIDTLNTIELLAQAECDDLLNSDYLASYHLGTEVKLLEILSLRAGYYHQKVDDYGNPTYNKDFISSFTYGFGVQIPLHKLCKIPLNINFDYTSLPQPTYVKNKSDWDNFTSYSFRLNWRI